MKSEPCRRTGTISMAVVVVAVMTLFATARFAGAQSISGASATTTGSTGNSGDTSGSTRSSVAITSNTATQIQTRFAWNVSADVSILSTRDQAGTAVHNVAFNVTAPGAYFLNVTQQRVGIIQVNNDASNCNGSADTAGITGSQSGGAVTSGSLNVGDPGSVGNTSSTTEVPFNQSASAQITATSNGVAQSHALTFSWNGSARSNSCEAAVRQGEGSSVSGCEPCVYPGTPSRTQANDGHFVTVTLVSLCGNGTVDGARRAVRPGRGQRHRRLVLHLELPVPRQRRGLPRVRRRVRLRRRSVAALRAPVRATRKARARAARPSAIATWRSSATASATTVPPTASRHRRSSAARSPTSATSPSSAPVPARCPADEFAPSTQSCRGSAGVCDVAEFCAGDFPSCPPDGEEQ